MPGDDGCTKCVIDQGMGRSAAKLYGAVINRIAGLRPIDYHIHDFYINAQNDFQAAIEEVYGRFDKDQLTRLFAQLDKACYHANDIVAWCDKSDAFIASHAAGWTTKFIEWVKEDQDVYVALIKEIK